jgi:L-iditol 2-dehydrogenase
VALENLSSGALRWEFMITHELGLGELPAMFQKLRQKNEFFAKIMFRP